MPGGRHARPSLGPARPVRLGAEGAPGFDRQVADHLTCDDVSEERTRQIYDLLGDEEKAVSYLEKYVGVRELNWYDASATGREASCAAEPACHSISRPIALADAEERLARLMK